MQTVECHNTSLADCLFSLDASGVELKGRLCRPNTPCKSAGTARNLKGAGRPNFDSARIPPEQTANRMQDLRAPLAGPAWGGCGLRNSAMVKDAGSQGLEQRLCRISFFSQLVTSLQRRQREPAALQQARRRRGVAAHRGRTNDFATFGRWEPAKTPGYATGQSTLEAQLQSPGLITSLKSESQPKRCGTCLSPRAGRRRHPR